MFATIPGGTYRQHLVIAKYLVHFKLLFENKTFLITNWSVLAHSSLTSIGILNEHITGKEEISNSEGNSTGRTNPGCTAWDRERGETFVPLSFFAFHSYN
eukprot:TRINITY_DN6171_c0_g1_i1.p1 TRINITY_DN6171_c0_g1~~TRINITY_DN6171_c0_g1_i1.p1  ORF type:complete len:100 (+),score=7.53 TRINITY_DN6171_c0_g1_i1:615-914(+)